MPKNFLQEKREERRKPEYTFQYKLKIVSLYQGCH